MGLDMYAWTVPAELATVDVDLPIADRETGEVLIKVDELHYWRKHPNLHGWMHQHYIDSGGRDPDFNGNSVRLTEADLDRLEQDVGSDALPPTSGCFFGASEPEDAAGDLEFIAKARAAIKTGRAVYYDSSW